MPFLGIALFPRWRTRRKGRTP